MYSAPNDFFVIFSAAVKFNQTLSLVEMENMMKALAECDFPFQCAHGRPSIAPVIDMEDFKNSVGIV